MSSLDIGVDEALLRNARQYADEHGTTLEALLAEHLTEVAARAGRRLTLREQIYVDHRPSEEAIEALRTEGYPRKQKAE